MTGQPPPDRPRPDRPLHDQLLTDRPTEGVQRLTMNRPRVHNAISLSMQRAIDAALHDAEADPSVKVLILSGTGDSAFSAGYDIDELCAMSDDELSSTNAEREAMLWRWFSSPVPTIAAIGGLSYGAGTLYAACSDIRVAGPSTTISVTAARYGGANLTWILDRIVGAGHARDMLMTSRAVGGDDALAMGLVSRLALDDDVDGLALRVAQELTGKPAAALTEIKRLLDEGPGRSLRERFDDEGRTGRTTLRPERLATLLARTNEGSTA